MLGLLAAHFIGDWFLQPRWMATEKSKNFNTLCKHLFIVSILLFAVSFPVLGWFKAAVATLMNAYAHGLIDWFGWGWYKKKFATYTDKGHLNNYWFYTTIGIDQFLHLALIVILFTT
jgi:hypothetical protein